MSKRVGKSGTVIVLSSVVGLMASCGPPPQQPTNVKPIPVPAPSVIAPTPLPGSSLLPVLPGPGQTPLPPGATPANPLATPTPPLAPGQLGIASTTLPTAAINFTYNAALTAVGGSGSYRWNLASGSLPNGLILDQATGQIFGKPTQTGTFSFEVQAIDTAANSARRGMFILVSDTNSGVNSVGVLTTSLVSGTIDRRYSQTINAGGGTAPYSWSISSGALPDGLSINAATGEISGTPKLQSEETFTVKVVDARGQVATKALSITINRTDSNIAIQTTELPIGILNKAFERVGCGTTYSGQLAATGGNGSYTWEVSSGTLPTGLSLSSSGALTGTPTAKGAFTFTLRVSDNDSNRSSKVFTTEIRDMLVHRFSPNAGGEGLRTVVEGENFGAAGNNFNVEFGGVNQTTITALDTTDPNCHKLTLPIPVGAKTGVILVKNTTTGTSGSSLIPFFISDVVINEIFTNPDNSGNQYVELLNKGSSSASIAGWHLIYTDINGNKADFTIPPETPPLAPGSVTVVNINKNGGNSASQLYTGTGLAEMRFAPNNLTQVALCTDANCTVTATDTKFRDYLQFGGAAANGTLGTLENDAVTSGIWTNDATVGVTGNFGTLDSANILAANAHNGTNDGTTANRGLLLPVTEIGNFQANDVVIVDNAATGGKINRLKRTVPAINGNRVTIDSPLFTSTIQSTNTGSGLDGSEILVDKITETFSALTVGDFVNVLAGGTVRTITELQTTGPKIELDTSIKTFVDTTNASDGLAASGGLLVKNGTANTFVANSPVTVTVGQGANAFTVTRNVVSVDNTNHKVVLDQALATAPISATNTGDGSAGNGIAVSSTANFIATRKALYRANTTDIVSIISAINGSSIELTAPIATMTIDDANTGTGASGSEITMAMAPANTIVVGNKVSINGVSRTVAGIIGGNKVQLDQPISMTITNTAGDGTTGNGIGVSSTQGFVTGNKVSIGGQSKFIRVVGNTLELFNTLGDANGATNNVALLSKTITAPTATAVIAITAGGTGGLSAGNTVRFSPSGQTRTITSVDTGTQITLSAAITTTDTTLNLVPTAGTIVMQGNATADTRDQLALVPFAGAFTLVPFDGAATASNQNTDNNNNDNTDGLISRVPTSGSIWLAPKTGTLRQYLSIKYKGSGNLTTDYLFNRENAYPSFGAAKYLPTTPVVSGTNGSTTVQVADITGFIVGSQVRFSATGATHTIQSMTPANFTNIASTSVTSGTVGAATVNVGSTTGFSAGSQVRFSQTGAVHTIQAVNSATQVTLTTNLSASLTTGTMNLMANPILTLTAGLGANITTGTVTMLPPQATVNSGSANTNLVNVSTTAGFAVGDKVRFSATGEIHTIASVGNNQVTLSGNLVTALSSGTMDIIL